MRKETDLEGVRSIAKQLVMVDLHLTKFSPMAVQHPFTSIGIVAMPLDEGIRILDITKSKKDLASWQDFIKKQIDHTKNAYHIYMMTNKPYSLTFLKMASPFLSQKDFSEILANAWIQSENPNLDVNVTSRKLLSMFKDADPQILMDDEERAQLEELDKTVTVYRGVTSYNADNIKTLSWTLDYNTAKWFAHRFDEDGTVYKATISKDHIHALFNGRNESEVIVDPKYLMGIEQAQNPDIGELAHKEEIST